MPISTTDPKVLKEANERQERMQLTESAVFKSVCSTKEGLCLLWDLIISYGLFSPLNPSDNRSEVDAAIGQRNAGLKIFERICRVGGMSLIAEAERTWRETYGASDA